MFPYAMCRGVRAVTDPNRCGSFTGYYVPAFSECHAPRGGEPGGSAPGEGPVDEFRETRPGWCESPITTWASAAAPRYGAGKDPPSFSSDSAR